GHGGLSGEDGGGHPADLGAWRVGPARADATAAGAQPPEPLGPPDEDEVERADYGAMPSAMLLRSSLMHDCRYDLPLNPRPAERGRAHMIRFTWTDCAPL